MKENFASKLHRTNHSLGVEFEILLSLLEIYRIDQSHGWRGEDDQLDIYV